MDLTQKYVAESKKAKSLVPGTWDSQKIEIFQVSEADRKKIGSFKRNYPSFVTFYPFSYKGREYALYSSDYTCTRVMTLPDCKDWCGEEPNQWGFCPVEYYVPLKFEMIYKSGFRYTVYGNDRLQKELNACEKNDKNITVNFLDFDLAFVAGCVWGDDSSWKIEAFDLTEIENKKLTRIQPFGYLELPSNLSLKEAVNIDEHSFKINTETTFFRGENLKFKQAMMLPLVTKSYIDKYRQFTLKTEYPNLEVILYNGEECKKAFKDTLLADELILAEQITGKTEEEATSILKQNGKEYQIIQREHDNFISLPLNPIKNTFYIYKDVNENKITHVECR